MSAALCELRPDPTGGMVIDVRGDVSLDAALGILRLAESLDGVTRVAINLDAISDISVDAADVLLFQDGCSRDEAGPPLVVLATGKIIRDAVFRAYARRRAREPWTERAR